MAPYGEGNFIVCLFNKDTWPQYFPIIALGKDIPLNADKKVILEEVLCGEGMKRSEIDNIINTTEVIRLKLTGLEAAMLIRISALMGYEFNSILTKIVSQVIASCRKW